MSNYSRIRRPLAERLPIVTYANRFAEQAEAVWMSPQVERITGYGHREWVDRPGFLHTVLHPDDRGAVLEEMRASREERRPFSRDYRLIRRDGETLWIHDESVPILDDAGEPELIQGFFVEIGERKELERQLLQAQRLAMVGRFAAGIAHDFNNFLTVIGAHAALALRLVPEGTAVRRHVDELVEAVEAAGRLTRQLLTFGRGQAPAPRLVDLRQVVSELRPLLRQVAGDWVRLELDLLPTPTVYADPSQLEQVAVNLVANARDAHAGSITLRTGTLDAHAYLTVTDDGNGMDAETQSRAFQPFFSTKEGEEGSGLGLSIVHRIVSEAGGSVELESATGLGTRAAIRLPPAPVG